MLPLSHCVSVQRAARFFRFLPSSDYAALKIKYRFERHDWRHCFLYIVLPMTKLTMRDIHVFGKVWRECHSRTVVIFDIVEEGSYPVCSFPKISKFLFQSLSFFLDLQTLAIMLIRDQVRWAVCLKTLLFYRIYIHMDPMAKRACNVTAEEQLTFYQENCVFLISLWKERHSVCSRSWIFLHWIRCGML